ncbi:MAG: ABC-2 transporter permease [Coriobacteriia bacterium]|nr:ABC-2 transporter permease [Coriobacteriia bacterium]
MTSTEKRSATQGIEGVLAFIRLEISLIRPYIRPFDLLLYGGVAFFLSFTTGNLFSGAFAGMLLGTLLISYPFALDQRDQTSERYTSEGFSPQTVVLGRYLYLTDLSMIVALAASSLALVGTLASRTTGATTIASQQPSDIVWSLLLLAALLLILLYIQLPLYFHLGYVRARFFSAIPLIAAFVALLAFVVLASGGGVGAALNNLRNLLPSGAWTPAAVVVILVVAGIVSYRVSLAACRKQQGSD